MADGDTAAAVDEDWSLGLERLASALDLCGARGPHRREILALLREGERKTRSAACTA